MTGPKHLKPTAIIARAKRAPEEIEPKQTGAVSIVRVDDDRPVIASALADYSGATATVRFPVTVEGKFRERLVDGCRNCPSGFWDETARGGRGACNAPRPCSRIVLFSETEFCPLKWWPEYKR